MSKRRKVSPRVTSLLRSFRFCSREAVKAMDLANAKRAKVAAEYAPDVAWSYHERKWQDDVTRAWSSFWNAIHNLHAAQKISRRKS